MAVSSTHLTREKTQMQKWNLPLLAQPVPVTAEMRSCLLWCPLPSCFPVSHHTSFPLPVIREGSKIEKAPQLAGVSLVQPLMLIPPVALCPPTKLFLSLSFCCFSFLSVVSCCLGFTLCLKMLLSSGFDAVCGIYQRSLQPLVLEASGMLVRLLSAPTQDLLNQNVWDQGPRWFWDPIATLPTTSSPFLSQHLDTRLSHVPCLQLAFDVNEGVVNPWDMKNCLL